MILAPILAQLIYFAVSRKREYLADASAAVVHPLSRGAGLGPGEDQPRAGQAGAARPAPRRPCTSSIPLKRAEKMAANATSTHPPIDERIRILRAMGAGSFAAYDRSYREIKGTKKGVIPGSALKEDGTGAASSAQGKSLGLPAGDRPPGG